MNRNPLSRRLGRLIALTQPELQAIHRMLDSRTRSFRANADVVTQGDRPAGVSIVLSGWAVRVKTLADGRRQILAILLPGEISDLEASLTHRNDHSLCALSALSCAQIDFGNLDALTATHPRLARDLRWDKAVGASIQREWTLNLGRRSAAQRFGHLFCELLLRLRAVGLAESNSFILPATQTDLADAMGISTVHANRTLQDLRQAALIRTDGRALEILDPDRLARLSLFDPDYLHLDGWRPDCPDGPCGGAIAGRPMIGAPSGTNGAGGFANIG